ncbi:glycoside hydrolase family 92 protein [Marinilabiliaceae bacterium JC017]|nr:glycoside hydrolase family 92 protein [Marinilabiliaceae bacterium JC017]
MKNKSLLSIFLVMISVKCFAQEPSNYVDPFIGTSNYGATYPGAVVPWGMASVVPFNVTPHEGNDYSNTDSWCSNPYVNNNRVMTGFTHVNLSGVGCPDFGSIIVMPQTGKLNVNVEEYGTHFKDEIARPGYYSMFLEKYKIKAEVTATKRSGRSRFTFPKGESHILIDLGHGLTNETGGMLKMVSDAEVEGYKLLGTFCYNPQAVMPVYFVARFSKPANNKGYWKYHTKLPGHRHNWSSTSDTYKLYTKYEKELAGEKIGSYLSFNTEEGETIEISVGVSFVSIENARQNLEAEQNNLSFEDISKNSWEAWNNELKKIEIEGGTHEDKVKFYTALYHVLLHPNTLQDVNGMYPAMESSHILTTENNRFTVFSLWDTYRTVHPFLSLVYPDKQLDMVRTMVDMYKESGWLPKWELFGRETQVMEGDPALVVIADSYLRGLRDFDVDAAYEAMLKHANTPGKNNFIRPDNDFYMQHNYVPLTHEYDNSVSQALEYYIAEYNLAQFSLALGKKGDYKTFHQRSLGYKTYFDKTYNLLRPVLEDGKFMPGFDPLQGENFAPVHGFHEGTSWQYSFAVPHDINGLMKLMKGKNNFVAQLNKCFNDSLFDMGNEPDIIYPYLFNYAKGEEWRTQKQVSDCIDRYFHTGAAGLPGNDDTGTMSAWLVYGMMGFYPVCPGNMDYTLTSPVFDKVTIHLDTNFYPNDKLIIEAERENKNDIYIQSIELNGQPYNKYFISHEEILKQGLLKYKLGAAPVK